jgi:hypothetical protein
MGRRQTRRRRIRIKPESTLMMTLLILASLVLLVWFLATDVDFQP